MPSHVAFPCAGAGFVLGAILGLHRGPLRGRQQATSPAIVCKIHPARQKDEKKRFLIFVTASDRMPMRGAESESRNVTDLEQCCSHGTGWSSLRILVQKNGSGDDRHVPLCMPLWAAVYLSGQFNPQHTVCQVHLRGPGKSATLQVTGVEALEIFPGTLRVSSLLHCAFGVSAHWPYMT